MSNICKLREKYSQKALQLHYSYATLLLVRDRGFGDGTDAVNLTSQYEVLRRVWQKDIAGQNYMRCSKCKSFFDLLCVNITESYKDLSDGLKKAWQCPICNCRRPKGDNSSTPIRSPALKVPIDVDMSD